MCINVDWGEICSARERNEIKFSFVEQKNRENYPAYKYKMELRGCLPFTLLLLLFSFALHAQVQTHEYIVSYKGNNVGNMQFYQNKTGENVYVKMVSNVQMNFLINIKVNTEEESFFQSGRLIYSYVSRKVNGKEKANKQTKATGDTYKTSSDGKPGSINNKMIDYNFSLLYCNEPVDIQIIYSDNFQQFLQIQKVSDHKYKIDLPDGNYNYYSFLNGICSNVEVHHTFYTIQITLKG
jgi:hypothetical protein